MIDRLRDESGQAAAEFAGWFGLLLIAGFMMWQLLLAGWTKIEATNSARTASRVLARADGDAKLAAKNSLPQGLRKGVKVEISGDKVTVRVPMPLLFPSFASLGDVRLDGDAELPS